MAIADLCHPTSSRQVTVMNDASTIWFTCRVQIKNNSHCFTPIGTFFCCIEQAEIGHEMALVVRRELCAHWWAVIEGWCGHGAYESSNSGCNSDAGGTSAGALPCITRRCNAPFDSTSALNACRHGTCRGPRPRTAAYYNTSH